MYFMTNVTRHVLDYQLLLGNGRFKYETFVEGEPNSHDPETCLMCNRASDEREAVDEQRRDGGWAGRGGQIQ